MEASRISYPGRLDLTPFWQNIFLFVALLAPAVWNGYPLLQYDTGGYLARWYEGYLVPSRSTTFGLYLHIGEGWHFWPVLIVQAAAAVFIVHLVLRQMRISSWPAFAIRAALVAVTALPFLASLLITDIFAGLSVLAVYLLAGDDDLSLAEKICLFAVLAFAAASHSATLGVVAGLCLAGWLVIPWAGGKIRIGGLALATSAVAMGAILLVATNFALSGRVAWTPGGMSLAFGRMMQDGIVKQYLDTHCQQEPLKLCPYKDTLPPTADDFLWGESVFNKLGRFAGLGDEMGAIAVGAIKDYPWLQIKMLLRATGEQLAMAATGEGSHNQIWHTYGIIRHFIPGELPAMNAARQQRGKLDFAAINRVHVPVALASSALLLLVLGAAAWRRRFDKADLLTATVTLSLLGNAVICGGLSGPHDRYGARIAWIATFAVLIALVQAIDRARSRKT